MNHSNFFRLTCVFRRSVQENTSLYHLLWIGLFVRPHRSRALRPAGESGWELGLWLPAGLLFVLAANQRDAGRGEEVMWSDAGHRGDTQDTCLLWEAFGRSSPWRRIGLSLPTAFLLNHRTPLSPDKISVCHNLHRDATLCKTCCWSPLPHVCFGGLGWSPWKQIWRAVMNVTISSSS